MTQKIAVAILHGIGSQPATFATPMIMALNRAFENLVPGYRASDCLVMQPIWWAPVLKSTEDALWEKAARGGPLAYHQLRRFLISAGADAIAYQPIPGHREIYDEIHAIMARALKALAHEAGADAPLCVISHSLGTIIASNYYYDLCHHRPQFGKQLIAQSVLREIDETPLEKGHTLAHFYTLGSPIAIWSLRYMNFGIPMPFPPLQLTEKHPAIQPEWVNFYDKDDVIGFPLRTINEAYARTVTADLQVNIGDRMSFWNPASHMGYWTDRDIILPIADALARTWRAINT